MAQVSWRQWPERTANVGLFEPANPSGQVGDLLDQCGGGDGRGARQVDDLADVHELVEPALPVVAHDEDVGLELLDVVALELEALLDEDLVDWLERGHDRHSLGLAEDGLATLLGDVERVGGHAHHEAVAVLRRALDDPQVPEVEDVERAEGQDGARHGRILPAIARPGESTHMEDTAAATAPLGPLVAGDPAAD